MYRRLLVVNTPELRVAQNRFRNIRKVYNMNIIVHLPVPKINSPGGADTASGEYTELRSVA